MNPSAGFPPESGTDHHQAIGLLLFFAESAVTAVSEKAFAKKSVSGSRQPVKPAESSRCTDLCH